MKLFVNGSDAPEPGNLPVPGTIAPAPEPELAQKDTLSSSGVNTLCERNGNLGFSKNLWAKIVVSTPCVCLSVCPGPNIIKDPSDFNYFFLFDR